MGIRQHLTQVKATTFFLSLGPATPIARQLFKSIIGDIKFYFILKEICHSKSASEFIEHKQFII